MTNQDRAKALHLVMERQATTMVPRNANLWPRIAAQVRPQRVRALPRTRFALAVASMALLLALGIGTYAVSMTSLWPGSAETPGSTNPPGGLVDMTVYSTFEGLSAASEVVVIGTVKGIVGREEVFYSANPLSRGGRGDPYVFYEVEVTETLRGQAGQSIIVARRDPEQGVMTSDPETPLRHGEQVLLFLVEQTSQSFPAVKTVDHWYVTVSRDNGVFDILAGDQVRPRMPELFAEATYSLGEVRQKVQGS